MVKFRNHKTRNVMQWFSCFMQQDQMHISHAALMSLFEVATIVIKAVLLFGFYFTFSDCANILALVPYNARSHFIVMEPLFKGLANKGHSVTVMSTFPQKTPIKNYKDIDMTYVLPTYSNSFTLDFIKNKLSTPTKCCQVIFDIGTNQCEKVYKSKEFQELLNQTTLKYDLLVTEIFGADCFIPLAHKWDIPIVSIVTSVSLPWSNDRIGNPDNPSYIPNYFLGYSDQMTFYERLTNVVTLYWSKLNNYYNSDIPSYELVKEHFGEDLPPLHEIARQRTSLLLLNSYFTVNQPRPFVPNVVEIGGIHLSQPSALPKEIDELLNKATHGFIYFSLGSLFRGASMDKHVIDAFLKAFSKLSQVVIWKFEEELKETPPNVIVRKWWPQREILLHKNVKGFLTHGGLSSTLEAVSSGVPVIGIPLFADQLGNINNIVRRGSGIKVNYEDITYDVLNEALEKLINNKSYMENAKEMSRRFNDRPSTPLENALFWVEYVLRHKGANFMHSVGADLPLYQYLLLDVIGFIAITLVLFIYIIIKTCSIFFSVWFNTQNNSVKDITKSKNQ